MNGTVYMDLGDAKLGDLSPQIQDGAEEHPSGRGGRALHVGGRHRTDRPLRQAHRGQDRLCDADPQQVEDQLFQNQISALARRYLRDLKRDANIQVRDDSKPDALIR